jgi:hypothetical protein
MHLAKLKAYLTFYTKDFLEMFKYPTAPVTKKVLVIIQVGTENKDKLELIRRTIVCMEDKLVNAESKRAQMEATFVNNNVCR